MNVKSGEKITFHVISHTHWDREWYLPFEVFRLELVELIDNLLDILKKNKGYIFHLDGQSIILQDYLEIKPEKREEIKKYVTSGNLLVGPWYVLSDQFLSSGESTVRNLLYGIRDSKTYGKVMLVGYCPDQFGQIAQLPQIFKGFNIKSAVVGRGIQDNRAEHIWHALDGNSILAISLTHWYNNAQRFPDLKDKKSLSEYIEQIYEKQSDTSSSGHILLMNGCDHIFPQNNVNEVLKSAITNGKWSIKQDSLPNAVSNILENQKESDSPVYFGELREDKNKFVLAGTLSSRVYLKLANYKCQSNLEKIVEPLTAVLKIAQNINYPFSEIKYAWKTLIQNHAHDSICGCSIDEVHKEMEIRFLKVEQIAKKLKETLLCNISGSDKNILKKYLQLINLTNYQREDVIEAEIEFPMGPPASDPGAKPEIKEKEIKDFSLKQNGKNIDYLVISDLVITKMRRFKDEVPLLQAVQKIKILFAPKTEPFSITTLEIDTNGENPSTKTNKSADEHDFEFENAFYRLELNADGTLNIALKKGHKHSFERLHFFTFENDIGDEYHFMSDKDKKIISSHEFKWDIKRLENNAFRKRFLLKTLCKNGTEIEVEITSYVNSPRIDFKTKVNNNHKNTRIRLHFPTSLNTNYIYADTPFGIICRTRPPITWDNHAASQPLYNWIDHKNDDFGLAFFGGGLADYELYEDGNGYALTLIRAVNKLSSVKSHSLLETPDAQCLREIEFSYAIFPHSHDAKIEHEQLKYQAPIITNQSQKSLKISSLITVSDKLLISSLKRSEDTGNRMIVRVFNPLNKVLKNQEITFSFAPKTLYKLTLNEEAEDKLNLKSNKIDFDINPFEILTFGIEI